MGEPLRGAVIGAGGIVARLRHIPAFQEAARSGLAEIIAICDPVTPALDETGELFGIAERYADWRDVVARDDIDVITIATPNSLHEPIAIAALQSGKHVMCEKPLALSLAGAQRMAAAARETGLTTSVNHRYRWVPAARYLKELVATGETGEVRQIFMNYFNALVADPDTPLQWRQTRAEGGGVLGDIGSHMIDLSMWLLGPITRVRCDLRTFTPERPVKIPSPIAVGGYPLGAVGGEGTPGIVQVDVDDAATCLLEFASGAVGVMNVSGVCWGRGNHQRVEVYGTKGSIIYEIDAPADLGGDRLHVCFGAAQHRTAGMATALTLPRHQETPLGPFLDFFRAIREGRPAAVTFDDAVRVQAVLEMAELSAAQGGAWVDLPSSHGGTVTA